MTVYNLSEKENNRQADIIFQYNKIFWDKFFPKQSLAFTTLRKKPFENTAGKGGNADK